MVGDLAADLRFGLQKPLIFRNSSQGEEPHCRSAEHSRRSGVRGCKFIDKAIRSVAIDGILRLTRVISLDA